MDQFAIEVASWLETELTPEDRRQIYGREVPALDPAYAMFDIAKYWKGKNADMHGARRQGGERRTLRLLFELVSSRLDLGGNWGLLYPKSCPILPRTFDGDDDMEEEIRGFSTLNPVPSSQGPATAIRKASLSTKEVLTDDHRYDHRDDHLFDHRDDCLIDL
ncbi:hypothetical protein Q9L58_005576 [Maublancomyces gigas]|uniref:Uncharacterized protein n=1 Tax=Discina gigas TaxID=1032678 RepID=A0ABR3GHR9_9PEZI